MSPASSNPQPNSSLNASGLQLSFVKGADEQDWGLFCVYSPYSFIERWGEKNYYHKDQQTDTSLRLVWEDLSLHRDYGLTDNWGSRIRLQIGLVTITHPHIMPILYVQLYEVWKPLLSTHGGGWKDRPLELAAVMGISINVVGRFVGGLFRENCESCSNSLFWSAQLSCIATYWHNAIIIYNMQL